MGGECSTHGVKLVAYKVFMGKAEGRSRHSWRIILR
jgi:hypothetical protein